MSVKSLHESSSQNRILSPVERSGFHPRTPLSAEGWANTLVFISLAAIAAMIAYLALRVR